MIFERNYKNVNSSETIPVSKVRNPFKIINGEIIEIDLQTRKPVKK